MGRFEHITGKEKKLKQQPKKDQKFYKKDLGKQSGGLVCLAWIFVDDVRRKPGPVLLSGGWSQILEETRFYKPCHGVVLWYSFGVIVRREWHLFGQNRINGQMLQLKKVKRKKDNNIARTRYDLYLGKRVLRSYRKLPQTQLKILRDLWKEETERHVEERKQAAMIRESDAGKIKMTPETAGILNSLFNKPRVKKKLGRRDFDIDDVLDGL